MSYVICMTEPRKRLIAVSDPCQSKGHRFHTYLWTASFTVLLLCSSCISEKGKPQRVSPFTTGNNTVMAYIDSLKASNEELLFQAKQDLDMDGQEEVVVALGYPSVDPIVSTFSQIYVLREQNGDFKQLGGNLNDGGYEVYEVKLIRLQNMTTTYVYCGLTNGEAMRGFQIYELAGDELQKIAYSASASGVGEDELTDLNSDGQMDGYMQRRWSYDVLFYPVTHKYEWRNQAFIRTVTDVEIPAYPETVNDVIVQYVSLRVLQVADSSQAAQRMSELCGFRGAAQIAFPIGEWSAALYSAAMGNDQAMRFDILKKGMSATVSVSFTIADHKPYKYRFHLQKIRNNWTIDEMTDET
jgi:hypothetical protein